MTNGVKKASIISIILILISFLIVFVTNYKKIDKDTETYNNSEITRFDSNQYMDIMINEETIVSIYLNEFINNTKSNVEGAYNTLNEVYRVKKFGNIEKFKDFLKNNNLSNEVASYGKVVINGHVIYDVIDTFKNRYIIKVNGIMNYELYLDDYTIEIK